MRVRITMKRTLNLDNHVAALLVGEHDANLRTLEDLLECCDISLRGNQLTLEGSSAEVERVADLVDELLSLVESGQTLDEATLELAASLTQTDTANGHKLGNIVSDVILEHRGRRIAPKTMNQKAYVDAIRAQHHHLRHRAGRHRQDLPGHGHGHRALCSPARWPASS